ncbi:hypothetical protein SLEP1_g14329 [Rubroshorea leprosula]|uniref:Uncharacterized protein n=1 Tax=Rubroshorea leprosula TaxID=152421 RepID=A0AAV5IPI1_9ROSI|nr:hypothetical protein SLEP1_g14329 [Rubroshorea leprosula]
MQRRIESSDGEFSFLGFLFGIGVPSSLLSSCPSPPPLNLLLPLAAILLWKLQPKGPQESRFGASSQMGSWLELNSSNLVHTSSQLASRLPKERDVVGKAGYSLRGKRDFQVGKGVLVPLMSFDNMGLKEISKDGNMIGSIWRRLGSLVLVMKRPIPLLIVLL